MALALWQAAPVAAAAAAEAAPPPWLDLSPTSEPADSAIQRRKYELNHEIALQLGGLPTSPFYKGYTASLGYTWHFNHFLAWQVLSATYAVDVDTNLKTQLLTIAEAAHLQPPELPSIQWFVASHLVLKPIYGKQALVDEALVHMEAYAQAGPALLDLTRAAVAPQGPPGAPPAAAAASIAIGLDAGLGVRVWIDEVWSVRAEVADLLYAGSGGVAQALRLQAGIAASFGDDA